MVFLFFLISLTAWAGSDLKPDADEIGEEAKWVTWSEQKVRDVPSADGVEHLEIDCSEKVLVPTQPTQTLKEYHKQMLGSFQHSKLAFDSHYCKINNSRSGTAKPVCLMADTLEFYIASDTYEDSCGHYYRGYYSRQFARADENMGTGWSPGHSMFQRAGGIPVYDRGNQVLDMQDGFTYPVNVGEELLFVGALLPGDAEKIADEKKRAEVTHVWDEKKRVWRER